MHSLFLGVTFQFNSNCPWRNGTLVPSNNWNLFVLIVPRNLVHADLSVPRNWYIVNGEKTRLEEGPTSVYSHCSKSWGTFSEARRLIKMRPKQCTIILETIRTDRSQCIQTLQHFCNPSVKSCSEEKKHMENRGKYELFSFIQHLHLT